MAGYREISQEYAKQGINAAFILNGGAALALLSQAADLKDQGLASSVTGGMQVWAVGTALAAATWIFGFISTRYVDKSEPEAGMMEAHLKTSDAYMFAGIVSLAASILFFLIGYIILAFAFS